MKRQGLVTAIRHRRQSEKYQGQKMENYSTSVDLAIDVPSAKRRTIDGYIIRFLDIAAALFGLAILAPIIPLIALLIRLDSPGSPIFRQKRAGKDGIPFEIYKFRTMCDGAGKMHQSFRNEDEPVVKLANDHRITRLGEVLRKYSIDELPQILNILKGDMSFVGPRPCVFEEVKAYNAYQRQRLVGKPGLTGLAQINGRSDLDFDSIVQYDIHYNRNRSIGIYLSILFRTIPYCLSCKSSY
jgi:lipopolysaccharide/colanic/teichoic acid biosynthesis glycosyltransferase